MKKFSIVDGKHLDLLPDISPWVQNGIARRIRKDNKITLVSAACPSYTINNGAFTYDGIGDDVPYLYSRHMEVVKTIQETLLREGIGFEYHVTLADTEFDLPLVVKKMANGDPKEFLDRCQRSCDKIKERAQEEGLAVSSCQRFTKAFPMWFEKYEEALSLLAKEALENSRTSQDLATCSYSRRRLYQAMSSTRIEDDYCRKMVLRQWAQYAAWGQCARMVFGENIVMMNHETPNLSKINYVEMNQNRERIPILQLEISTMPR